MNKQENKKPISIIFLCEGNVCRSPMAECLFDNLANKEKLNKSFNVTSRGTTLVTFGEPIYKLAKDVLASHNIPIVDHLASQITIADYKNADLVIAMELSNVIALKRLFFLTKSNKIKLLLDYTDSPDDIHDPYFTRDFNLAYDEISIGVTGLFNFLKKSINLSH
jgi:protein-tyrosine phosphatase